MKRIFILMLVLSLFLFSCNSRSGKKSVKNDSATTVHSPNLDQKSKTEDLFHYFPKKEITRYAGDVDHYMKQDLKKFPGKHKVLFTGSSSIRKWKTLQRDMAPIQVINRGFGGSTFPELIYYADSLIFKYDPNMVVIYEGDNDQLVLTPTQIAADARFLDSLIHARLPRIPIVFLSAKPSPSRRDKLQTEGLTNDKLKALSQSNNYTYFIDVWSAMFTKDGRINSRIFTSDSLHMNAEGYKIWTRIIKTEIQRIERK